MQDRQQRPTVSRRFSWRAAVATAMLLGILGPASGSAETAPATAGETVAPLTLDAAVGAAVFRRIWVSSPSSTTGADGLGPLYNARSCAQCHPGLGRGEAWSGPAGEPGAALVLRLSIPPATLEDFAALQSGRARVIAEPVYGQQLQTAAIQGHAAEGRLMATFERRRIVLADGEAVDLVRPVFAVSDLAYGAMRPDVQRSPRLAPSLHGLGLLAAVAEREIRGGSGQDGSGDTAPSGRASLIWSPGRNRSMIGRFGWKAGVPTLRQQIAEAFAVDMGLSTSLLPAPGGDCTARQVHCLRAPHGADAQRGGVEVGDALLDALTGYVASLPPPVPPMNRAPDWTEGASLFEATGCATCHRPSLALDPSLAPYGAGAAIAAFTDLRLHDMGEDLADGRPEGAASGGEWRAPPLWGIGQAARKALLHDGRARTVTEAILWHGGEGRTAREAFAGLPRAARERLIRFVESL